MSTGARKGLNPARKVGSAPDNKGLSPYSIASGYATALGLGDPVKLASDGTIERGTNDTDNCIGVFAGVQYTDSQGEIKITKYWPASTVATDIVALVIDDPAATFTAVADAAVTSVQRGQIYPLNIANADSSTGRSTMTVDVAAAVAADAGMVKVINVVDEDNKVLEVVLADHDLRDDANTTT